MAAGETQASLTVQAASTLNPERRGAATVTISEFIRYDAIGAYLSAKPPNAAASPYTVKVERVNIRENGIMGAINQGVAGRYVILDLSACFATDNTITSSNSFYPGVNDMNVIKDNQYIVGVILPDSLTAIGDSAFYSCAGLTGSLTILSSVTSIGSEAFSRCAGLTSVTIPASVTSIGQDAFSGWAGLTSVTFDGSISPANFFASDNFPGDLRA